MLKPFWFYVRPLPTIVDQSSNALHLIASNTKMHTLTVENIPKRYQSYHFTESVFKSIYNHCSLANIKIHLSSAPSSFTGMFVKSLPAGIRDFELSVKFRSDYNRQIYPKDGYYWQQGQEQEQEQEQDKDIPLFSSARALKLERLALGRLHSQPSAEELATTPTSEPPPVVIDGIEIDADPYEQYWYSSSAKTGIETVKSFAEQASGLRHLVVKDYLGSWSSLLQLLLDNCPDLETIELTGDSYYNISAHSARADTQLRGYFPALKEFRMMGAISEQMYTVISKMVVRSSATLEVVWINCTNWQQPEGEILNVFHIETSTSWTQCTRLKELGLHRYGGLLMTDPCWDDEATTDSGMVFGQLEKLRLGVKEPLWRECSDQHHVGGTTEAGYGDWGEFENEDYYIHFDERDDEDWKPLEEARQTKQEKIWERDKQQAERAHQRAFIHQVRELFGRLKDLKHLKDLEIEWAACSSIRNMTLEYVQELFKDTEVKDSRNGGQAGAGDNTVRTSKGWWGEVTQKDLVWLCLPWAPQPHTKNSGVHPNLIKAAARQYENKTQLHGCCNDTNGIYDHGQSPWSTGDIYKARVGRAWRDWWIVIVGCHPHGVASYYSSYSSYYEYEYGWRPRGTQSHAVNRRDYEIFVEGDSEFRNEAFWKRKMATRGDGGRYRQKVIGKLNQRK
ncbi:hypothetical protein BGX24_000475 [Mortierella sp. AD032]|nr:hypothetical protein BGX24_000475 [Mortierella sp. AD032]